MAKSKSKGLVIDSSVARAAGLPASVNPRAAACRDVLDAILAVCHKMVSTPKIAEEWKRHRSAKAAEFEAEMKARKKRVRIDPAAGDEVYDWIRVHAREWKDDQAMWKDAHLIAASLEADRVVLSLDEAVRRLFGGLTEHQPRLKEVSWANPERADEKVVEWLSDGAPEEADRRLRPAP